MNRNSKLAMKIAAAVSVATVMGVGVAAVAAPVVKRDCLPGIQCLDVWDPVICSNGVTYSNSCYAAKACATGCYAGATSR